MNECKDTEGSLPDIHKKHKGLLQKIQSFQDQERVLQKDSVNMRLKIVQISSSAAEHQSKIKHTQRDMQSYSS